MYIYSKSNRCLIRDIAVGWKLETTLIEGINSIIKLIVKRAPYISWMLLAARIAIKKNCCNYTTANELDKFLEECVSNHTSAQELLELDRSLDKDLRRFEEPKLSEYVFSMPPPRKKVKTTEQLFVAKFLSTINKELKLYDRTLEPSASWILRLRLWDAEKFEKDDVYMISYRHGYVYWVVPMQLCTNSTVEWELPIKAVPLYEVVRRLYSIACESAPTIISAEATYVNIKWVFNCFSKAAIHDELPLLDLSNFLKPTQEAGARAQKQAEERTYARGT